MFKNLSLLPSPKAVIFDFDNTLVDTLSHIKEAKIATLKAFKANIIDKTLESSGSSKNFYQQFDESNVAAVKEFFYQSYKSSTGNGIKILQDAEVILQLLKNNNIPQLIISNKTERILLEEVNMLGWEKYFIKIVGSNGILNDKPSRDPVDKAFKDMPRVSYSNVWFIGDSNVDVECALACGAVPIVYGDMVEFSREKFDCLELFYIQQFSDLINHLQNKPL
jgi:phosphoglycolate phosphatase